MARLGALGELDLDHLDLRLGGGLGEPLGREGPVPVAAAEIAAGDLPDDVAAALLMVHAEAALAGVMGEAPGLGALVERADRVGGERAEAHGGDVEQGARIGLLAVGSADLHAEVMALDIRRRHGMGEPFIALPIDILLGAEGAALELALRAGVDHAALAAVEGRAIQIAFEEILADFRPHAFEQKAQIGHDWIITAQGVMGLDPVPDPQRRQGASDRHGPEGPGAHERGQRGEQERSPHSKKKGEIAQDLVLPDDGPDQAVSMHTINSPRTRGCRSPPSCLNLLHDILRTPP